MEMDPCFHKIFDNDMIEDSMIDGDLIENNSIYASRNTSNDPNEDEFGAKFFFGNGCCPSDDPTTNPTTGCNPECPRGDRCQHLFEIVNNGPICTGESGNNGGVESVDICIPEFTYNVGHGASNTGKKIKKFFDCFSEVLDLCFFLDKNDNYNHCLTDCWEENLNLCFFSDRPGANNGGKKHCLTDCWEENLNTCIFSDKKDHRNHCFTDCWEENLNICFLKDKGTGKKKKWCPFDCWRD